MKKLACMLLIIGLAGCWAIAYAECAWVATEKGPLNIRSRPDSQSPIIGRIPNGELIAAEENDDIWSCVSYEGETGYAKTEYLRYASQMVGKAIYPDGDYLYLRAAPGEGAASVAVVHADQAMEVQEIEGLWAKAVFQAGEGRPISGYAALTDIAQQRETPSRERTVQLQANLTLSAVSLSVGDVLDVTVRGVEEGTYCYRLYCDELCVFEGKTVQYAEASYRPRKEGRYRLEVIACDPEGNVTAAEAFFEVNAAEESDEEDGFCLYSQFDGWWRDKPYGKKNLESSGCAIFALAHALNCIGRDEVETKPEALAQRYGRFLAESGTLNSRLLAAAAIDFQFVTADEKVTDLQRLSAALTSGAVLSFLVVRGHVALAVGLSEDGTKVWVVDSAPSATFERIEGANLYYQNDEGRFCAAEEFRQIPGARYYFETDAFGGLVYALDLSYVAQCGARLIMPDEEK